MRREMVLGVAFLLAGIAEMQWGSAWFRADQTFFALLLFVAGVGMLLAAGGSFVESMRDWAIWAGVGLTGIAHAVFFAAIFGSRAPIPAIGAGLLGAGLIIAAWGVRADLMWMRLGLAAAAVAGIVWAAWDVRVNDMSFMIGNVFGIIGWGLAAFTPSPKLEMH